MLLQIISEPVMDRHTSDVYRWHNLTLCRLKWICTI